jgi:hypothetical protein
MYEYAHVHCLLHCSCLVGTHWLHGVFRTVTRSRCWLSPALWYTQNIAGDRMQDRRRTIHWNEDHHRNRTVGVSAKVSKFSPLDNSRKTNSPDESVLEEYFVLIGRDLLVFQETVTIPYALDVGPVHCQSIHAAGFVGTSRG